MCTLLNTVTPKKVHPHIIIFGYFLYNWKTYIQNLQLWLTCTRSILESGTFYHTYIIQWFSQEIEKEKLRELLNLKFYWVLEWWDMPYSRADPLLWVLTTLNELSWSQKLLHLFQMPYSFNFLKKGGFLLKDVFITIL